MLNINLFCSIILTLFGSGKALFGNIIWEWKVSGMDKVRNEEVRRRAGIERELASRADQRVLRWFGYVERMDDYRMAIRGRVDDLSFLEYLSPFCFLLIEFHCTFSISYKILLYFG